MILKFFKHLLYDERPATFVCRYDTHESIQRLSSVVKKWPFVSPFRQALVGKVKGDEVIIYRVRPFVGNSCIPVFYGAFHVRDGVTALEGIFSMQRSNRTGAALWFGFIALMAIIFPIAALSGPLITSSPMPQWQAKLEFALTPLGLLIFGVLTVKVCKWFARTDVEFISKRVQATLHPDTSPTA
jgi:hypothetical protein